LGIADNILVKTSDFFVPVDFVVLDMYPNSRLSLILGRPFLSTANAHIDVGKGSMKLTINGQEEQFTFKPKQEFNSSTKMVDQDKLEESPESPTLESSTE